jgi:chromate transporter
VIASLGLRLAMHTLFGEVVRVGTAELPVPASLNGWAAVLALLAGLALFRFKLGVGWTILLAAAAGAGLYVAGFVPG